MRRSLLVVAALLASTSAFAQTIDQQGADALTTNLKRYVGQAAFEKKILTVDVDGDAYRLGLDFQALMAALPKQAAGKINASPYALRLKPRTDGSWDVSGPLAPNGSFEFPGPDGPQTGELTVTNGSFTGIFDPALSYFSSANGSNDALRFTSTDGPQAVEMTTGAGTFDLTGKAGANGGVDIDQKQTLTNVKETISAPAAPDMPPVGITVSAPKMDISTGGTGFRISEFLNVLTFAVEHSEEAKFKAAEGQFKQLLVEALPLWDKFNGSYAFSDFAAVTPYGSFGAGSLGVDMNMDGIGKAGTLDYGMTVSDLKLPEGIAPTWSAAILPTDISLRFGGANLNLDGPARKFLAAMELGKEPPVSDAVSQEIAAEFLASAPKVTITNTSIRNSDTEITVNGEVTFPNAKPDVAVTFEVSGFDKLEDALKTAAASDPSAAEMFPMILAAKGFGKALPDGNIQWMVNVEPDGSVKVNGVMLKGPDEVAPDVPLDPNAPAPGVTNPTP